MVVLKGVNCTVTLEVRIGRIGLGIPLVSQTAVQISHNYMLINMFVLQVIQTSLSSGHS